MPSEIVSLIDPNLLGIVLGLIVGLILGTSGAGGGIIAVPLLVFGLNLPIKMAAPVGLIAVGLAAGLGAVLGLREGIVRYRAALLIGAFGMIMAPLGVWLAQRIPNAPLLMAFSLVLLYTAWRMFLQSRQVHAPSPESSQGQPCRVDPAHGRFLWTLPCARALAGTGLLSGLLSGLLGVGGGFVIVPALSRYTDLLARSVLATSLAVITLVAIGGISAAALQGAIVWSLALPFSSGAVLGLLLGRMIAKRVAGARLQQSFAALCVLAALLLLARGLGWVMA
jgi:uncharacterized membrane protein YfcA